MLLQLSMKDQKLGEAILQQTNVKVGDRVLDFGCGTGALAAMTKQKYPEAVVQGVDVDPEILKIARDKSKRKKYAVTFKEYDGAVLPFKDESFDKVLSRLVFHHLVRKEKTRALGEIYRILKEDGELYILDFGQASNILMRGLFLFIQLFDGFKNTSDNVKGLLPIFIREAGFEEVTELKRMATPVGNLSLYKAIKTRQQ